MRVSHDFLDGLLANEQARQDGEASFPTRDQYELRLVDQVEAQERFCSIAFDGLAAPVLVGLLSQNSADALSSSALENLVLWAIVDPTLPLHDQWDNPGVGVTSAWRTVLKGKAILALPTLFPPQGLQLLSAMFGLHHGDLSRPLPVPRLVPTRSTLAIAAGYQNLTSVQARLLSEAGSVSHPKWRFMSLYRILENSYLTNIKNILMQEFDADATRALKDASEKVGAEVNQLVALADTLNMQADFIAFSAEVDTQIAANNRFMTALDRNAAKDGKLYGSPLLHHKGVLRFYKLRCAIAHAGTSSVVYEQFADADAAVTTLLPVTETIALKCLWVS